MMEILGYIVLKKQIGFNKHTISLIRNDNLQYSFILTLQPTGFDDVLPTYQLFDNTQYLPKWLKNNLNSISDWIIKDNS